MKAEEFNVWDDTPEADFAFAAESQERVARERAGRKSTLKRGGLRALAEQASMAVFGMSLSDLDQEARKTLPPRRELDAAHEALRVVAGYDPDHAELPNRIGFARSDVVLGHALASAPSYAATGRPGMALLV